MLDTLYNGFAGLVGTLNDLMYSYVLIILLIAAGVYFTIRTAGVQVRLLGESVRVVSEKSGDTKAVSAFEALMVSTASRVGTAISSASPTPSPSAATARCSGCGSSLWLAARPPCREHARADL